MINFTVNETDTNDTIRRVNEIQIGKIWRPIKTGGLSVGKNVRQNNLIVKATTSTAPSTVVNPSGKNGIPKSLLSVSATESPSKQQDRTYSEVSVSFSRDGSDPNFSTARVWFKGYQGNPNAVLMADGNQSPITFLCESTGETVVVTVQPVSPTGLTADLSFALSTTVALDGVVSAPPAPSISQSLIGTALGYQFSFNQVVVGSTQDVIDSYRVYRNTINDSTSATFIRTYKHDRTASGAIVVSDNITEATASYYYYWVSAVNTVGLESTKTAAQSSSIIGSIGSVPPSLSTPFKVALTSTTATFTTSPSCFFARADGTVTQVGSTTQAVTGLTANNTSFYFPYWRESDQSLQWLTDSDVVIPSITGATFTAGSSQWVQTTTSASVPAAFSFEVWVKGTTAANQALLSHSNVQGTGAPGAVRTQAYVTSAGEVVFSIWNGASWQTLTTSGATVLDGSWHHICCTYVSGTTNIYVDSANTSDDVTFWTKTGVGTISNTAGYWHIGFAAGLAGAPLTSNTFNSFTMSHVTLYSSTLTVGQVGAHFQAFVNVSEAMYGSEVVYDSATNYWKLNETSGTNAADSIGSNTGTYQNSPTLNQTSLVITVQGSPAIAWPYITLVALQQVNLRDRIDLSGGISAKTPASGSSSGSGGGSSGGYTGGSGGGIGGCFTGGTLVKTHRGPVAIDEIVPGDKVLTARGTWRQVLLVIGHPAEPRVLHQLPGGGLVTYGHRILVDGQWVNAGTIFTKTINTNLPVYTLTVLSGEPESLGRSPRSEHSFTLEDGTIASNVSKFSKD